MITENKEIKPKRVLQRITNKRVNNGQIFYFVTWKGLPEKEGMWLPIDNLLKCQKKIDQFEKKFQIKKRQQIKRRILLRKIKKQLTVYQKSKMNVNPLILELKQIKLDSDESLEECSQDQQPLQIKNNSFNPSKKLERKPLIKVSRYDCINGIWFNKIYTKEELEQINELRQNYSLDYQTSSVVIKKIKKINSQQVVLYERQNKMYQCLLQNFKLYLPQLLIQFILQHYNPAQHQLIKTDIQKRKYYQLSDSQDQNEQ